MSTPKLPLQFLRPISGKEFSGLSPVAAGRSSAAFFRADEPASGGQSPAEDAEGSAPSEGLRSSRRRALSSKEKRLYVNDELRQYCHDPIVVIDLSGGLLILRPTFGMRQINRITRRFGSTIFAAPSSMPLSNIILYSYRPNSRLSGKTHTDLRAHEAAEYFAHFVSERFREAWRRAAREDDLASLIAAKALVFELRPDPPFPAMLYMVDSDGAISPIPSTMMLFPPRPEDTEEWRRHQETVFNKFIATLEDVHRKSMLWIMRHLDLRQQEFFWIAPYVAAISRLLHEEHSKKMLEYYKERDKKAGKPEGHSATYPGLPFIEGVFLSRATIQLALAQEGQKVMGSWRDVWLRITPPLLEEAFKYDARWREEVGELESKAPGRKIKVDFGDAAPPPSGADAGGQGQSPGETDPDDDVPPNT